MNKLVPVILLLLIIVFILLYLSKSKNIEKYKRPGGFQDSATGIDHDSAIPFSVDAGEDEDEDDDDNILIPPQGTKYYQDGGVSRPYVPYDIDDLPEDGEDDKTIEARLIKHIKRGYKKL